MPLGKSKVYAPELGTASYSYNTPPLTANAYYEVYSDSNFCCRGAKGTLSFNHSFLSGKKTPSKNASYISSLTKILESVGAKNIKYNIYSPTNNAQNINVTYSINGVMKSEIDPLCKSIADACDLFAQTLGCNYLFGC